MLTLQKHKVMAGCLAGSIGLVSLLTGCTPPTTSPTSPTPPASTGHAGHEGHGTSAEDHSAMGHEMNHTMGTKGMDALKSLKGKEFDIAFLSQMIAHHAAAVEMAEAALKTATKKETKEEAKNVIATQTREIGQMTVWLKDWYKTEPDKAQQALVQEDMKSMMAMPITSDDMFFQMMIPHHQGAVDMGKLVPERAERTEVKKLAKAIADAQDQEIKKYHKLLGHAM